MTELLDELAALRRLIDRLAHDIERLKRQFDRTEKETEQALDIRPLDDTDDGSD